MRFGLQILIFKADGLQIRPSARADRAQERNKVFRNG